MCNLYSVTTNQAAIIALSRVMNRSAGSSSDCLWPKLEQRKLYLRRYAASGMVAAPLRSETALCLSDRLQTQLKR
jgi:hypothetical protein